MWRREKPKKEEPEWVEETCAVCQRNVPQQLLRKHLLPDPYGTEGRAETIKICEDCFRKMAGFKWCTYCGNWFVREENFSEWGGLKREGICDDCRKRVRATILKETA